MRGKNVLVPLNSSSSEDLSDLTLFWSVNPFSLVAPAVWPLSRVSDSWGGTPGADRGVEQASTEENR